MVNQLAPVLGTADGIGTKLSFLGMNVGAEKVVTALSVSAVGGARLWVAEAALEFHTILSTGTHSSPMGMILDTVTAIAIEAETAEVSLGGRMRTLAVGINTNGTVDAFGKPCKWMEAAAITIEALLSRTTGPKTTLLVRFGAIKVDAGRGE